MGKRIFWLFPISNDTVFSPLAFLLHSRREMSRGRGEGGGDDTNEFSKSRHSNSIPNCNNYKVQTMLLQQPKDQEGNVGKNVGPWYEKEL